MTGKGRGESNKYSEVRRLVVVTEGRKQLEEMVGEYLAAPEERFDIIRLTVEH